ncbi:cAMP-responsive element modulator [Nymphon striatum]|nr:cAMP-responsive element modulator [Nymphon striatum]
MMMDGLVDDQHDGMDHQDALQVGGTVSGGQTMAVQQPGGTVSIVHVSIPSGQGNNGMHSVIQNNQQSVIQTTPSVSNSNTPTVHTVHIPKNVIFLNKSGQSVIQSTEGETMQTVQVGYEEEDDEASKKRREILARRPSYRKILNDLSSTEQQDKDEECEQQLQDANDMNSGTITVANAQAVSAVCRYFKSISCSFVSTVMPSGAIQIAAAPSSQADNLQGLQTLAMSSAGTGTIVQYAQSQDGQQFFVPVTVSASDLQAYQIRAATGQAVSNSGTGTTATLPQGVVMASASIQSPQQLAEDVHRKREVRLLKNREAAKECRRKKKEYIKCLENRVAVLETQNKALIEELKSLKELYCQKTE